MVKKILLAVGVVLLALLALVTFAYADRGRPQDAPAPESMVVLAHRGVHVRWVLGTYDPVSGCEASHIAPPTHNFIENTLASMAAAFAYGATIVELDIRHTADDQLVVFHDSDLACRTDGTGLVRERPLDYLKGLDIGYGYTADGGATYPLRGQGVGLMPTLPEVLAAFPDRSFLIDHKDGTRESAELLVAALRELPPEQQDRLYYWGPDATYAYLQSELPHVTRLFATRRQVKGWLIDYLLTLGFGGFPAESEGLVLGAPPAYARYFPGWPYRFLHQVDQAGADFYLMIDSVEEARRSRALPIDGIITDGIETVGPALRNAGQ